MTLYQNIDGVNFPLTDTEVTAWQAQQAAYVPAIPPIPDLATQLAAALINNGTLQSTDINATTLASVNTNLRAAGQSTIAISVQGA